MVSGFTVVIVDHAFDSIESQRSLLSAAGARVLEYQCKNEEEVAQVVDNADAIMCSYAPISRRVIQRLTCCRIIAKYGIGVDNIDLEAASELRIPVTNVPDYCVDEVSDHALAMILAFSRRLVSLNRDVHAGIWNYSAHAPMHRLSGATLGLVGFGRIARRLAQKAVALGMRIASYDPFVSGNGVPGLGVEFTSLEDLVTQSDYISIHCPLTPQTRGLFGDQLLALAKPTAVLINTSRGGIVDELALRNALIAGRIGGAALDVLCIEGRPQESPLFDLPQVLLTPHCAFYSVESSLEVQRKAAEEVIRVLTGNPPVNLVNREVLLAGGSPG